MKYMIISALGITFTATAANADSNIYRTCENLAERGYDSFDVAEKFFYQFLCITQGFL